MSNDYLTEFRKHAGLSPRYEELAFEEVDAATKAAWEAAAEAHKKAAEAAERAFKGWKVPVSTSEPDKKEAVRVKVTHRKGRRSIEGPQYTVFVAAGPKNYESLDLFMNITVSTIPVPYGKPPEITVHLGRLNVFASSVYHGVHWRMDLGKAPTEIKGIVAQIRKDVNPLFPKYFGAKGRPGWQR